MRLILILLLSILPYSLANSQSNMPVIASADATIDFNHFSLGSYGSGQDMEGDIEVSQDGLSLSLSGNRWQYIDYPYVVSANTVIEFDFQSDQEGEIHGLGMDNDLNLDQGRIFKLYGQQDYGNSNFNLYHQNQVHFRIPIGEYYQGPMSYLFFANDHDVANPFAHSQFSNLRIYEMQAGSVVPFIQSRPNLVATVNRSYIYDGDQQINVDGTGPIQFELTAGPEGLSISSEGEITWTPQQSQEGDHYIEFTATNAVGADTQGFTLSVSNNYLEVTFQSESIDAYGGAQDGLGNYAVQNDGASLFLQGNLWKKQNLNVTITPDTKLEFDFYSANEGEIHGIGFDYDTNINADKTFQVFGTQRWGIASFNDYQIIDNTPTTKHYVIPIGQYYTGTFNSLFFVNDQDVVNPTASGQFSNIRIHSPEFLSCGALRHGESVSRERFFSDFVNAGSDCESETQTSTCSNGTLSDWTGTFAFESCEVLGGSDPQLLPLIEMNAFYFIGGFRVRSSKMGNEQWGMADYSEGIFTYNPNNHSIFLAGHPYAGTIAEFAVPEIVNSTEISDFNQVQTALQNFVAVHQTPRVDTGISDYFRITGMELIDGQLMVNYINWYDAAGTETDTSIVIKDASNLQNSAMLGPYQLQGAAHSAGWLSPIPLEWQNSLEGTYIAGNQANASIISRLSVGPSAFTFDPQQSILSDLPGAVGTSGLLDFSLNNMLYDQSVYSSPIDVDDILYNRQLTNNLWTIISGAGYGFIVPGTRTYLTLGSSGGHETGLGYKIIQDDGNQCGGPCPYSASDYSNYYWLWDVNDLMRVKNGEIEPHDVRPYQYGVLNLPVDVGTAGINGGAFDSTTGNLYLSLPGADTEETYSRPPLFIVYKIDLQALSN